MDKVGVQTNGNSPSFTKKMALSAIETAGIKAPLECVADIGGGYGELSSILAASHKEVWLVDYAPPEAGTLPPNVKLVQADLNEKWLLPDAHFDFSFSLECIEHVENPRHFMREITRITKPSGYIFLSTPNNHSLASKLIFMLRGEHRFFQKAYYPAHVSALLKCDFERMASEMGLRVVTWVFSNTDSFAKLQIRLNLPGPAFSMVCGILLQKP